MARQKQRLLQSSMLHSRNVLQSRPNQHAIFVACYNVARWCAQALEMTVQLQLTGGVIVYVTSLPVHRGRSSRGGRAC